MSDYKELREHRELIKMREAARYDWRQDMNEEKEELCDKCEKAPCECEEKEEKKGDKKAGKHPFVDVMPVSKDGLKESRQHLSLSPNTELRTEEMSVKDQMAFTKKHNAENPRKPFDPEARKKQRAAQLKNAPKDTRTDAQKMTDATGPRKGSNFRGD